MSATIKLSDKLIEDARRYGKVFHRSMPKQIEHWATIGKIAEDNPDLPYDFIKDILISLNDLENGNVTPFEFD